MSDTDPTEDSFVRIRAVKTNIASSVRVLSSGREKSPVDWKTALMYSKSVLRIKKDSSKEPVLFLLGMLRSAPAEPSVPLSSPSAVLTRTCSVCSEITCRSDQVLLRTELPSCYGLDYDYSSGGSGE